MYNKEKVLALIPARGGSKGIKNKNIIDFVGKPLISYTINAAKNSKYIDDVIVTTDSKEIADVAEAYGAEIPFIRPKELASDNSKTIDAVMHAIDALSKINRRYDVLVLLQPTQPLRTKNDIDEAIELFFSKNKKGLVSVSQVEDHPLLIRTLDKNDELSSLLNKNSTCRRQDMPTYLRVNGCIYINSINDINEETSFNDNKIGYLMKKEHSVDIDDYIDLEKAKYYLLNEC